MNLSGPVSRANSRSTGILPLLCVLFSAAPYQRTFGEVPTGKPLVYINSLLNLAVALNQQSYAALHKIESGPGWSIEISKD